jgi:hypothetical protein
LALNAEGRAMRDAVLADCQRIPGVKAFTIDRVADEETEFRAAARSADWSLVIAPEFNDILLSRCRWVQEEKCRLLNPAPAAVQLCSDKLALANHWMARGVPTPPTFAIDQNSSPPAPSWVVKPRYGAGSQDTLRNGELRRAGKFGPMIVQPLIEGLAASVAFLCGPRQTISLPAAEQILSSDGHFRYLGGLMPLQENEASRAEMIARTAVNALPDLTGYIGVDVLLGNDCRDWAIEINPRLTTSYLGLRALAEENLAEAMLRIAEGSAPPPLRWRSERIEFTNQGQFHLLHPINRRQ